MMSKKITIVCTCRMGPGTFDAKFVPLSRVEIVERIIVIRKDRGPDIPKLNYIVLPKACNFPLLNLIITPFIIAQQVKKHKASVILAYHYIPHYFLAWVAAKITKVPYILGQTGSDDQKLALKKVRGYFLRKVIKEAARLNVPGNSTLSFWRSLGFTNVGMLHSSIDTDYFVPSNQRKEFDFIYIGRLEDYKGVDLMIHAVKKVVEFHPNITFAIVGNGSGLEKYRTMVKQLGLSANVLFFGFQKNVRDWLHRGRIFVMASDCEGLPCSLMEAMSCGMVCIASNVGNIGDVIKNKITGFCFQPRDPEKLVDLMLSTYLNESEMQSIKFAAREIIVEGHSYTNVIDLWSQLFDTGSQGRGVIIIRKDL